MRDRSCAANLRKLSRVEKYHCAQKRHSSIAMRSLLTPFLSGGTISANCKALLIKRQQKLTRKSLRKRERVFKEVLSEAVVMAVMVNQTSLFLFLSCQGHPLSFPPTNDYPRSLRPINSTIYGGFVPRMAD